MKLKSIIQYLQIFADISHPIHAYWIVFEFRFEILLIKQFLDIFS